MLGCELHCTLRGAGCTAGAPDAVACTTALAGQVDCHRGESIGCERAVAVGTALAAGCASRGTISHSA